MLFWDVEVLESFYATSFRQWYIDECSEFVRGGKSSSAHIPKIDTIQYNERYSVIK